MAADKKVLVDFASAISLTLQESSDGGKFLFARGEFGRADVPTQNRRTYPRKVWQREIQRIQEAIKAGKVLGHLEHPSTGKTSLEKVSHIITGLDMQDDGTIVGEAKILNNEYGRQLRSILEAGGAVGVSSRGLGSTMMGEDGMEVVQDDYSYMTHDFVADPAVITSYPKFQTEVRWIEPKSVVVEAAKKEQEMEKEQKAVEKEMPVEAPEAEMSLEQIKAEIEGMLKGKDAKAMLDQLVDVAMKAGEEKAEAEEAGEEESPEMEPAEAPAVEEMLMGESHEKKVGDEVTYKGRPHEVIKVEKMSDVEKTAPASVYGDKVHLKDKKTGAIVVTTMGLDPEVSESVVSNAKALIENKLEAQVSNATKKSGKGLTEAPMLLGLSAKLEAALDDLKKMTASGVEYPDAEHRVAEKHKLSDKEIKAISGAYLSDESPSAVVKAEEVVSNTTKAITMEEIKKILMPYILPEETEAAISEERTKVAALTKQVSELTESVEKLGATCNRLGVALYFEKTMKRMPERDQEEVTAIVGDIKKYEDVRTLEKAVMEAKKVIGNRRLEEATKRKEMEAVQAQLKAFKEEKKKEIIALEERNKKLEAQLKESLEQAKALGIRVYLEERIKDHPNAGTVRKLCEGKTTKEEVDAIVKRHSVMPVTSEDYNSVRRRFDKFKNTQLVESHVKETAPVTKRAVFKEGVEGEMADLFPGVSLDQVKNLM